MEKFTIVRSPSIPLATSFVIHPITLLKGADKNSRFQSINAEYFSIISFCFIPINMAQSDTIIEYHTSVYVESIVSPVRNGFIYAKINENSNMVLD